MTQIILSQSRQPDGANGCRARPFARLRLNQRQRNRSSKLAPETHWTQYILHSRLAHTRYFVIYFPAATDLCMNRALRTIILPSLLLALIGCDAKQRTTQEPPTETPSAQAPEAEERPEKQETPPAVKEPLFPLQMGAKGAFIDAKGKVIFEGDYGDPREFNDGIAIIYVDGKPALLDRSGKVTIPEQKFFHIEDFSEGLARVQIAMGKEYGFIDKAGKLVIPTQLRIVGKNFSEGLVRASPRGKKENFINKKGEIVLELPYDRAENFSEGLAAVRQDDKWGFIDKTGELAIQPKFDRVHPFSEGHSAVQIGKKWGYIDKTGAFTIPAQFEDARSFSEKLALVKIKGKWGFIDPKGEFKIKPQYSYVTSFCEGLAAVGDEVADYWGAIDTSGNMVFKPKYWSPFCFKDGLAYVAINTNEQLGGYIDTSGKVVASGRF
ncbi:hypothetical protein DN745_06510 [Bradymonas sediminis]|uniref:WG repeat-containing protein n=2 Tax=Bradymonas sediminis TaxID=1548548 RepID=A0A2Z4FJ02_9DELT|nr:hypothetical protein DN745_06510 [Bradymonas sediminis]